MKLLYFSWIRERLDRTDEEIDLPQSVQTVGDLLDWQKTRGEEFEAVFEFDKVIRVAINQEHIDDRSTELKNAKEIAFFPPMTGG
ncbi:MAG: molybdopterin converting factor subunit 1 [Salaquimonas sp.]